MECSPDLVHWTLVATGVSTNGVLDLTDRAMSNFKQRHYRVMFEP
jgi:beta-xylosidase